jgi:hypothetical protein
MHDQHPTDPGRYATEIGIMREMGWSWADLMATPGPVVAELRERLQLQVRWERQRRKLDEGKKAGGR